MPRSLDPSARLTMVLACDVDKPPESQPRIFARTLTLNQQRKLMSLLDGMKKANTADEKISVALDAAEICLIGWENMTDPASGESIGFSRETIGDVLSLEELTSAAAPSGEDKKKSESQPS